jgi:hypothetical protein
MDTDATSGQRWYLCESTNTWAIQGVSSTFNLIGAGTNANALVMGTGGSLGYSGTGIIDATRFLGVTTINATEFGYLDGVTSAIQTQIGTKAPIASPTFTGTVTIPTPFTLGAVSVLPTGTELNFVDGVTSSIQNQIDAKSPIASPTFTGVVTMPVPFTLGSTSITTSAAQFNYINTLSSNAQTQIDGKAATSHAHAGTDITSGTVGAAYLPANTATSGGIVTTGAGQNAKVWKTDASGVPDWRADATGTSPTFDLVATGTNTTEILTVGTGGTLTYSGTGLVNASRLMGVTTVDATEYGYLDGVTSAIQTQLGTKSPIASPTFTGTVTGTFSGNITGDVTGNVSGNAGTATALAANPTDCGANTYATTIAASGNLTCAAITNGSLDADLQTLAAPTAWRVFYSNGTSVITQLALGASGTYLMSNGASAAPTFETPSGSGDVTDVGNCTGGACGDGTSDGGTYIELYSASGNTRIVNTSGVLEAKTAAGAAYANFKAASISTEASDGYNKLLITNNTAFSPTAASMEMYPEGNIWKFNENGTEYASVLAPLAGPIKFTGPTAARSYALPDAAATILTNNAYVIVGQGGTGLGSGTSGGIPYYSSGNAMTSSAALTQYGLIVGGGAGATPYALTDIGTSAKVLHGNATGAPTWSVIASGDLPTTITGLTSVSSTGFTGALTGNASTATLAATSTVVDSTDTSSYVAIFDSATGSLAVKTDTGLTYNAGTGMLTATGFTGPLTGNVIGSAATLTTARTINGTSFNGSADIHNTFSKCVTIKGAVATDDFPVEHFPYAITITATSLYMQGSTALVGGFDECTGSGGICTTLTPFDTTDMTASAANTWYAAASAFENAAIAANNGIFWHTTSVTGTNTFAIACFTYTVD